MSIGVVCLIKSHRAGGQPAPFNYQVQVGRDQVVPTEAEGLHVEWEASVKSLLAEGKLDFTKFENNLTPEGVVFDVGWGL